MVFVCSLIIFITITIIITIIIFIIKISIIIIIIMGTVSRFDCTITCPVIPWRTSDIWLIESTLQKNCNGGMFSFFCPTINFSRPFLQWWCAWLDVSHNTELLTTSWLLYSMNNDGAILLTTMTIAVQFIDSPLTITVQIQFKRWTNLHMRYCTSRTNNPSMVQHSLNNDGWVDSNQNNHCLHCTSLLVITKKQTSLLFTIDEHECMRHCWVPNTLKTWEFYFDPLQSNFFGHLSWGKDKNWIGRCLS